MYIYSIEVCIDDIITLHELVGRVYMGFGVRFIFFCLFAVICNIFAERRDASGKLHDEK